MRHLARCTFAAVALAGCAAPEPEVEEDPVPTDPWAAAFAPYAGCTMEIEHYAYGQSNIAGRTEVIFDASGRWIDQKYYDIWYADGDVTRHYEREIGELGREMVWRWVDDDRGEVDYELTYTWDEVGPVSGAATSPSGAFAEEALVIEHDALGRATFIEVDYATFDGEPEDTFTYEYGDDARGRGTWGDIWLADHEYLIWGSGRTEDIVRTFDDQGRLEHRDNVGAGPDARTTICDWTYDDETGREAQRSCVCPDPCWSWPEDEAFYLWTCPEPS